MNYIKLFRYLFMFLLTLVGVSSISYTKLNKHDILTITMFATLCFMFIDLYYPVVNI